MKKYHVKLTEEQRLELQRLVGSGRESARKITRARVLLKADAGQSDQEIAEALDVSVRTAERVRKRFDAADHKRRPTACPSRRGRTSGSWTARPRPS